MPYLIRLFIVVLLIPAAFAVADPARAGAVITVNVTGARSGPQTHTLQVGDHAVKMVVRDGVSIYDMATDTTRYYNDRTRTYFEISPADASVIRAGMEAMRRQLEAQLPNLPEAQRRRVEALLQQQNADADGQTSVTYRKLGRSQQVGSWRCEVYERLANGAKNAELCLAATGAVGLNANDLKAIGSMARAMTRMTSPGSGAAHGASAFDPDALSKAVGFAAFPVQTTIYFGGQPSMTTTVASVERRDIPDSAFVGPPGYTKQSLGNMMMQGQGRGAPKR